MDDLERKGKIKVTRGPRISKLQTHILRLAVFLDEECPDGRDIPGMWSSQLLDRKLPPGGDPISLKAGKLLCEPRKYTTVPEKQRAEP